ncbi:MAG: AAA family ATPase [Nocardioidaceae bacterium]
MTDHTAFIATYKRFLDDVVEQYTGADNALPPLTADVNAHLGADARELAVVRERLSPARLVDADLALADVGERGGRHEIVGVVGGRDHDEESFAGLLRGEAGDVRAGPADYVSLATGPDTERQVVSFGIHLLTYDGQPIAVLQRDASREWGLEQATLEVLATDRETAASLLSEVRRLMIERSVLRGRLVSFSGDEYESTLGGITFHRRPQVAADEVVLPAGTMERLSRHVIGVGEQRERMLAAGQHLKRGILLYGPPGTGKTLTVRHLLGRTETTAIMLSGRSLGLIGEATKIARAMQPAIIVLEDCDLIAQDRDFDDRPDAGLFEFLDALDGLDGDADVTFLLTTNRADLLERALAQRPGRIDLAVPIPLPDESARRALFALYGRGLPFSAGGLDTAATRSEGVTASFAKELVRRAVLNAAIAGSEPDDVQLSSALDELLSDAEALTRSLLASGPRQFDDPDDDLDDPDDD